MFGLTEASTSRRAVCVGCPIAVSAGSILAGKSFMLTVRAERNYSGELVTDLSIGQESSTMFVREGAYLGRVDAAVPGRVQGTTGCSAWRSGWSPRVGTPGLPGLPETDDWDGVGR